MHKSLFSSACLLAILWLVNVSWIAFNGLSSFGNVKSRCCCLCFCPYPISQIQIRPWFSRRRLLRLLFVIHNMNCFVHCYLLFRLLSIAINAFYVNFNQKKPNEIEFSTQMIEWRGTLSTNTYAFLCAMKGKKLYQIDCRISIQKLNFSPSDNMYERQLAAFGFFLRSEMRSVISSCSIFLIVYSASEVRMKQEEEEEREMPLKIWMSVVGKLCIVFVT